MDRTVLPRVGEVVEDATLKKCWQYESVAAANAAGMVYFAIVSYGKNGLTVRGGESRHSFVIAPKDQDA